MAYTSSLVDDLSCSICCDIFIDPVILSCCHSFCKGCLQTWWTEKQQQQCPLCKKRSKTKPLRNIALKNLSEAFQRGNVDLCPLHDEKLKLFCLDDLETACLICRHSEKHANHRFLPVDEAAASHREEIQKLLKPQKEKLAHFVETKRKCEDIAAHISVQAAHTERPIQKEFKKLHQFLKEEEKSRITALRNEEQLKGQKIKKEIEELSKQIETISHTVTETEQQLVAGDIPFLKKFKATLEKVDQLRLLPALPQGALLDVAKHLGNLAYAVWKKLEERQQLPENPERLKYGVLGSESHETKTCTWEVEVIDSAHSELGVRTGNKGNQPEHYGMLSFLPDYHDVWMMLDIFLKMGLHNGRYRLVSSFQFGGWVDLPALQKLQRVRIKWDRTSYEVSFIDPQTNQTIHSLKCTSLSVLSPFINSTATVPSKISPGKEL